jgi:hypothetical protein
MASEAQSPLRPEDQPAAFRGRRALALRLVLSFIAGPALVTLFVRDIVYLVAGLLVAWPLYIVALAVALYFAKSVVARPAIWTAAAVLIAAAICVFILPFTGRAYPTAVVGIVCACISGAIFYLWSMLRPIGRS